MAVALAMSPALMPRLFAALGWDSIPHEEWDFVVELKSLPRRIPS